MSKRLTEGNVQSILNDDIVGLAYGNIARRNNAPLSQVYALLCVDIQNIPLSELTRRVNEVGIHDHAQLIQNIMQDIPHGRT